MIINRKLLNDLKLDENQPLEAKFGAGSEDSRFEIQKQEPFS